MAQREMARLGRIYRAQAERRGGYAVEDIRVLLTARPGYFSEAEARRVEGWIVENVRAAVGYAVMALEVAK